MHRMISFRHGLHGFHGFLIQSIYSVAFNLRNPCNPYLKEIGKNVLCALFLP